MFKKITNLFKSPYYYIKSQQNIQYSMLISNYFEFDLDSEILFSFPNLMQATLRLD